MEQKPYRGKLWEEMSTGVRILIIIAMFAGLAAILTLVGLVVMWLWNWLMPKLFGLPLVGYWEAWGVLILSFILFGTKNTLQHLGGEIGRRNKLHIRLRAMRRGETPGEESAGM